MKHTFLAIVSLFLLAGCWSSQELDDTALVHGIGLDKSDNQIQMSFEIIKPGGQGGGGQEGSQGNGQGGGQNLVLEETARTLLQGARESIKYTKRRLNFGHAQVQIIGDSLAKEGFIRSLDILRRERMIRLNSELFVTKDKPMAIFNTPTFYDNLVSTELASSLSQTKFVNVYAPITLREFYKSIEGPVSNAYIPIIDSVKNNKQHLTSINGTAVIKKNRMIGELNQLETAGLNVLLNNIQKGPIQASLDGDEKVVLELSKLNTKTIPELDGNELSVTIQTNIKGTLNENMTPNKIDETFFKKIEREISKRTRNVVRLTLDKLQTKLKTDITNIGPKTYRKYPKKWQSIRSDWNKIFANANITIDVNTEVTHQGLIDENIHHHDKSYNNPYWFLE